MLVNATNITSEITLAEIADESTSLMGFVEGGLILMVCIIGLGSNIPSVVVLIRHKSFRNSFGYLSAYHALSNVAILTIFTFWAIPWTIWPIPAQMQTLNLRIGQLSLFFVETAFHCCLFISVNRFLAITYPMHYRKVFTDKVTFVIIIFVSLISACYWSIYFVDGCDFYFDHEYRVWSFGSEQCSVFLSFYIDMSYNVCLFLLVGIIDITTLLQLRSTTRSVQSRSLQNDKQNIDIISRRRRKEKLFFLQAFMNSLIYAFMLVCFHLISRVVSTDFQLFLCTTFIWGFSHAAGGVILIAFNGEVRRHLLSFHYLKKTLHGPVSTMSTSHQYPKTTLF